MKWLDVANEFAKLDLFNAYSQDTAIGIANIFSRRAEIIDIEQITLDSLALFKSRTLALAKPVTYNGYLRYLRLIGDYALSRQLITKNLFRDVKLAPVGAHPPKIMSRHNVAAIDAHLRAHSHLYDPHWFWLSAIYCLYYTGMRRRQLVNLKMSDVDFEIKTILLRREGSKTLREWKIPLHDELANYLKALITSTESVTGKNLKDDDFLFQICRLNKRYKDDGKGKMRAESVTGFFKRLSRNTGLKVGAHRFRHTLATALCNPEDETAPDIFVAQAILGHTSLQTTRNYVTTSMQRMTHALNKITQ